MKTSAVSLGPILSRLLRISEDYQRGMEMDSALGPCDHERSWSRMERDMRAVVEAAGLSVPTFNAIVRSRVGGRWLSENHHWALLPSGQDETL